VAGNAAVQGLNVFEGQRPFAVGPKDKWTSFDSGAASHVDLGPG